MRSSAISVLVAVLLSLCVQPTEAVRPRTSAQRAARSASSPSGTPCAALPAACGEAQLTLLPSAQLGHEPLEDTLAKVLPAFGMVLLVIFGPVLVFMLCASVGSKVVDKKKAD